jgi:hypothetical protein
VQDGSVDPKNTRLLLNPVVLKLGVATLFRIAKIYQDVSNDLNYKRPQKILCTHLTYLNINFPVIPEIFGIKNGSRWDV